MQLFVSDNASSWTQVSDVQGTGIAGGIDTFNLSAAVSHRYVKLQIDTVFGHSSTNVVIAEFWLSESLSLMQQGVVVSTDGAHNMNVVGVTADSGFYDGGLVTWLSGDNAYSSIEIRQWVGLGNQPGGNVDLFMRTPFPMQVGDTFTIQPGCDKLFSTCQTKFNNAVNFKGEPSAPSPDRVLDYPDYKAPHS